jgi:hypothetical protein
MRNPIDKGVYAGAYNSDTENSPKLRENHSTNKVKAIKIKRLTVVSIVVIISAQQGQNTAYAASSIDALKLYAHSRIIDYKQFQCFNELITKESNWNINAVNGSHYGLGQMKNPKYKKLDGYSMIDWSIRYQRTRYGSHCNALAFFKKNGFH